MCLTPNVFLKCQKHSVRDGNSYKNQQQKADYISNDLTAKHLYVHPDLQHERSEKHGANERIFSLKIKVFYPFQNNYRKTSLKNDLFLY